MSDERLWLFLVAVGLAVIAATIVAIRRKGRQLRQALLDGQNVLGRWQVSQADLAAFRLIDRERTALGPAYQNHLSFSETAREGLPIIVGKRDWLIGTRLYRGSPPIGMLFCSAMLFDGDPGYVEVAMAQSGGGGHLLILLRLPVPMAARSVALATTAALAARVPPQIFQRLQRSFPDYVRGLAR